MSVVVTAFVPIPDHPRGAEEYHRLAEPLLELGRRVPFMCAEGELERCWLYDYLSERYQGGLEFTHSVADNPAKNSLAYHIVQAQKTEWLQAATLVDLFSKVFVWIDYGIFHIPGVTTSIILDFLKRTENEQAIAIPGCWSKPYAYREDWPCWRFCGGVMVVPRQHVSALNAAMKREYIRGLQEIGNISWEVNTLARVEKNDLELPIWHYLADHDKTIFTNYQATENADGKQAQEGARVF